MSIPAPFDRYRDVVRPEWIDHNRHMNMGYYMVVFDYATDEFFRFLGLSEDYRTRHNATTFTAEGHITYQRELLEGDRLRFTTQLLGFDAKRVHYVHMMYHADEGYLAATNELMTLHISEETRRTAPIADEAQQWLADILAVHETMARPPQVGRIMGLNSKPTP